MALTQAVQPTAGVRIQHRVHLQLALKAGLRAASRLGLARGQLIIFQSGLPAASRIKFTTTLEMVASFSSSRWWTTHFKIILRKAVFETHTNKFIFYKYISRLLRIGINHSCSKIFVSFFALYERSSNSRLCGISTWYCFYWKNVYQTSIKKSYHFETVFGSCKCQCSTKKALLLIFFFPIPSASTGQSLFRWLIRGCSNCSCTQAKILFRPMGNVFKCLLSWGSCCSFTSE